MLLYLELKTENMTRLFLQVLGKVWFRLSLKTLEKFLHLGCFACSIGSTDEEITIEVIYILL